MKDKVLILLLHAVSRGSSFLSLVNAGYTFSQLALLIKEATNLGYIKQDEFELSLTEEGETKLSELLEHESLQGKKQWLLPQSYYKIKPRKKYDIILPEKIL